MDFNLVSVTVMIALAVALLGGHILAAAVVWQHFSWRAGLLLTFGLSLFISLIWNYGGLAVCYFFVYGNTDTYGTPPDQVCMWTFSVTWRICEFLPELRKTYGMDFCSHIAPLLLALTFFLLLSLLLAPLTKRQKPLQIEKSSRD